MTHLITYYTLSTLNTSIDGTPHTIRLSVRKDGEEYILILSNNQNGNQSKWHFNKEIGEAFQHHNGEKLETKVKNFIAQAIKNRHT